MKNYYVECSINYTDNSDDEIFVGVEYYSLTLPAKSKEDAEIKAKNKCKELFDREAEDSYTDIKLNIDNCYETTDDARSS